MSLDRLKRLAKERTPYSRELREAWNALPCLLVCAEVLSELLTECPSRLDEATFPKGGINDTNRKQVVFNLSVNADRIKRGEEALREIEKVRP